MANEKEVKTEKAFKFYGDFKAATGDDKKCRIKGYASTFGNTDRYGDIISPVAFDASIKEYMTNPVLLINHDNNTKAVLGHVEVLKIDEKGLYIEAVLTEAPDNASDIIKIKEGSLKAFSIGGYFDYIENVITKVRLYEISVVAIPANQAALFEVKSLEILTAELKKGVDKNQAQKMLESIDSQVLTDAEKIEAKKVLTEYISAENKNKGVTKMTDAEKALKDLQEKNAALEKENAEIRAKEAVKIFGPEDLKAALGTSFKDFAASLSGEMKTLILDVKDRATKKYEMPLNVDGQVKKFTGTYKTKEDLTKTDKQLLDLLLDRKGMSDGGSATGSEFIPSELAAELIDLMRIPETLPSIFFDIPMPTPVYALPINASNPTWNKEAENAGDAGARYTPSNIGTGKVTLTAVKLTCRVPASEEFNEDSIIPVIDWFKAMIAVSAVEAMSQAILDGDTTSSHQDSDVTASTDIRKAWKGLRVLALAIAGLKVDLSTFSTANVRSLRKAMGKYGVNPSQLAWIAGPSVFNQLRGVTEATLVANFGAAATIVNGNLVAFDGIQVITSGQVREDLNASGVYDGSTKTKTYLQLVNKTRFIIGTKREMAMKVKEDLDDQVYVASSMRKAFSPVQTPSATVKSTAIGYNITA